MPGQPLRVTRTCVIAPDELEWSFSGSGGPGGQHANTSNTRVELRFDIEASPSLGPRQRARLIERLGPRVRIVASERRSQLQNRELALERLQRTARGRVARRSAARRDPAVAVGEAGARRAETPGRRTQADSPRTAAPTSSELDDARCPNIALVVVGAVRGRRRARRRAAHVRAPAGRGRAVHARDLPFGASVARLCAAEPQLRGTRSGDGAVRAARVARVPRGRARRHLRRVRVLLRGVRSDRAGATRSSRAARLCSRSGSSGPAGSAPRSSRSREAAIGLALLAVLIAYLPTIYGSFSRRETMVTQLSVRGGTPPTAWRMLELAHRAGFLNDLDPVWNEWMQWFCELSETHTSTRGARVLPVAEPEPFVDHRGRDGARCRGPAAGAGEHPVLAGARALYPVRLPGAAGDRRLLRLRARSRPVAGRSDQRGPRRVHGGLRAARRARACRSGRTGSGPGKTSRAGGSTTTGCCSPCAAS